MNRIVNRCCIALATTLMLCVLLPQKAFSQASATAQVTAEVQQPLSVTKNNDLSFNEVFPGTTKTVAVTDADAALFTIQGQASSPVSISLTLPNQLTSGANSLSITSWTGAHNTTANAVGATSFDPATTITPNLNGTGGLYVYVGARVDPGHAQAAGNYSANMTINVVYF